MPAAPDPAPPPPKPRKRWLPRLRFSLRTLVVGVLLVGSAGGLWWRWEPWSVQCRLVGHSNVLQIATFSHDSNHVLTTGWDDNTATLWSTKDGHPEAVIGPDPSISKAIFDPSGKMILTYGRGSIRSWSLGGEPMSEIMNEDWRIHHCTFTADSRAMLVCGQIGAEWWTKLLASETGKPILSLNGRQAAWPGNIAISPDQKLLATLNDQLQVWDIHSGKTVTTIKHGRGFHSAAFSPSGAYLITISLDKELAVWNVTDGACVKPLYKSNTNRIFTFLSPDGHWAVVPGPTEDSTQIIETDSFMPKSAVSGTVYTFGSAFSPDGSHFVTAAKGGARVWETATGRQLAYLVEDGAIHEATYSPDGQMIVTNGFGNEPLLWHRRRPEYWWGVAWLPEFWLTALFAGALGWSVWRDGKTGARRPFPAP